MDSSIHHALTEQREESEGSLGTVMRPIQVKKREFLKGRVGRRKKKRRILWGWKDGLALKIISCSYDGDINLVPSIYLHGSS